MTAFKLFCIGYKFSYCHRPPALRTKYQRGKIYCALHALVKGFCPLMLSPFVFFWRGDKRFFFWAVSRVWSMSQWRNNGFSLFSQVGGVQVVVLPLHHFEVRRRARGSGRRRRWDHSGRPRRRRRLHRRRRRGPARHGERRRERRRGHRQGLSEYRREMPPNVINAVMALAYLHALLSV